MSVGGIVVAVRRNRKSPGVVCVATKERQYPKGRPTATHIEDSEDAQWISVGDSFWWQGDKAYWTPQTLERSDVPLKRIGFSHGPRPECPA